MSKLGVTWAAGIVGALAASVFLTGSPAAVVAPPSTGEALVSILATAQAANPDMPCAIEDNREVICTPVTKAPTPVVKAHVTVKAPAPHKATVTHTVPAVTASTGRTVAAPAGLVGTDATAPGVITPPVPMMDDTRPVDQCAINGTRYDAASHMFLQCS